MGGGALTECYRVWGGGGGGSLIEGDQGEMGSHLQKSKDGRKMPKMQMAAFFGKRLLSQLLHYLESHVWGQK